MKEKSCWLLWSTTGHKEDRPYLRDGYSSKKRALAALQKEAELELRWNKDCKIVWVTDTEFRLFGNGLPMSCVYVQQLRLNETKY